MIQTVKHQYSRYANTNNQWFDIDNQTTYRDNLSNKYEQLKEHNWIDKTFSYKINSHGFRSEEFTHDPSIMFLGCSFTCGIGLPLENMWAYIVSQHLGLKMANFGIGGTGPDTAFRLAYYYISQIKPKIVVYLEPPEGRFSVIRENDILNFTSQYHPKEFENFYNEWIIWPENQDIYSIKHYLAIQGLCNANNVKLITPTRGYFKHIDLARDLMHFGIKSNENFSQYVLNLIGRA